MKHQLKTIRSKLSPIADGDWDNEMYVIDRAKQALTALSELERMAGDNTRLRKALEHIEGVAMADEPRDLPGIVETARAALKGEA